MKLKNMWKRFWTLDVHNHAGFTLVELIIVIAILAILSTGAIAGYSAYVEKANITADKALIAEIENVLTLHAYSNSITAGGYVKLSATGATAEGQVVINALTDAYGENWESALKLKYSEWVDEGNMFAEVLSYDEATLNLINNSTFLTTATPEGLMSAITNLTGAASNAVGAWAGTGADAKDVAGKLGQLGFADAADKLAGTDLTPGTEEYYNAVSNILVGEFANKMQDIENPNFVFESTDGGDVFGTALLYASLYAYCESNNQMDVMEDVNTYLGSQSNMDNLKSDAFLSYLSSAQPDFFNAINDEKTAATIHSDMQATLEIMGALEEISNTYTSGKDLGNAGLYSSDAVSSQVNNYVNAVKAASAMDLTNVTLAKGEVLILLAADGSVSVIPKVA